VRHCVLGREHECARPDARRARPRDQTSTRVSFSFPKCGSHRPSHEDQPLPTTKDGPWQLIQRAPSHVGPGFSVERLKGLRPWRAPRSYWPSKRASADPSPKHLHNANFPLNRTRLLWLWLRAEGGRGNGFKRMLRCQLCKRRTAFFTDQQVQMLQSSKGLYTYFTMLP
jgi:hypothetical protein